MFTPPARVTEGHCPYKSTRQIFDGVLRRAYQRDRNPSVDNVENFVIE